MTRFGKRQEGLLSEHVRPQTNHVPDMKINFSGLAHFRCFHPPTWLMKILKKEK